MQRTTSCQDCARGQIGDDGELWCFKLRRRVQVNGHCPRGKPIKTTSRRLKRKRGD